MKKSPLWQAEPQEAQASHMAQFSDLMARTFDDPTLREYAALHRFSCDRGEEFWQCFIAFAKLHAKDWGNTFCTPNPVMYRQRFFPQARMNLAQNLLPRDDHDNALLFIAENQCTSHLSWRQLNNQVSRLQQALSDAGLQPGDRVCAVTPNAPEAVITMLATLSLGATFSSCSPDFGVKGILERFAQIKPTFMVCADGYWYNGKAFTIDDKTKEVANAMQDSLRAVIRYRLLDHDHKRTPLPENDTVPWIDWVNFIADYRPRSVTFTAMPFDHPAFILFSSGTTGKPKCFVHGQGSFALSNRVDLMLHNDVRNDDCTMFFTTCGWMMWNWLIGALGLGSRLVLYDGSPMVNGSGTLFRIAQEHDVTLLGLSPKLLSLVEKNGFRPIEDCPMPRLRRIATTGSPMSKANFQYVYQHIKAGVHLSPISGGTDILGCFLGGDPRAAVYAGEMQVPLLGKDVVAMDDQGQAIGASTGGTGELVCRRAFIGMPIALWNDPDYTRYHTAYFTRFDNVWCHGDYLEKTATGYIIHGRSDTVLNPGGVRIGTAEIYAITDTIASIADAVVVGQQWKDDVRVVLFIEMQAGAIFDDALCAAVRQRIRQDCSPRHVPAVILPVNGIPRTRSGKISEKAVSDTIHGRPINNRQALANPETLINFANRRELQQP